MDDEELLLDEDTALGEDEEFDIGAVDVELDVGFVTGGEVDVGTDEGDDDIVLATDESLDPGFGFGDVSGDKELTVSFLILPLLVEPLAPPPRTQQLIKVR